MKTELLCPFCQAIFVRSIEKQNLFPIRFCAYCGTSFMKNGVKLTLKATHIVEHLPDKSVEPIAQVGRYTLLKNIGKGGMGEVFLAYDSVSGRRIALKRIRTDLVSSPILRKRFIREARITSQLIHPSIIPIYDIHIDKELIYYTMPYVEGETLRNILKKLKFSDEHGASLEDKVAVYSSFQSLISIFLDIAQAVAFAHSRGILHRDLKPENVIVGTYGQVIILDWGLTKLIEEKYSSEQEEIGLDSRSKNEKNHHLTKIGKLLGTIAYMAPERAIGSPASVQTDIYALGVILYQILTLTIPFYRKSMAEFQKKWTEEKYIPPDIRSPHRDIPHSLSKIVKKCLTIDPKERFSTVDDLITFIQGYLEGRSEWTENSILSLETKSDWSFEEHILLTEHSAISTPIDMAEWCRIVISKKRFSDNVQISANVLLHEGQQGIGFLLGIPDEGKRHDILEGYCIWLGSEDKGNLGTTPSKILRHGISILEIPEIVLQPEILYHVRIERIDKTISVWINGECAVTKTSFLPVIGEYVGVMVKDAQSPLESISVASGSINILVNRLAVPDAFLANRDFDHALIEYRKIAALFPGRYEGKEALFRAGVCLLEKAEFAISFDMNIYHSALDEFAKLKNTSGAPLEYLGKALVYHALSEYNEEIKCFELAFMRFPKHPLLTMISEYLLERMHEMSRSDRKAAYGFISLVMRKIPPAIIQKSSIQRLFTALERSWEIPSYFIHIADEDSALHRASFCLILSFWLQKCYIAYGIFQELIQIPILPKELLFQSCAVLLLTCPPELEKSLVHWKKVLSEDEFFEFETLFTLFAFLLDKKDLHTLPDKLITIDDIQMKAFLMDRLNASGRYALTLLLLKPNPEIETAPYLLEAFFNEGRIDEARKLLSSFPEDRILDNESPLFFWYGILLLALGEEKKMEEHFQSVFDTPNPKSWLLGAHIFIKKILIVNASSGWLNRSFAYEREILSRQLKIILKYSRETKIISHSLEIINSMNTDETAPINYPPGT